MNTPNPQSPRLAGGFFKSTPGIMMIMLSGLLSACATLHTEEINYSANGQSLKGYIAYDKKIQEKRPGILVVHEWRGHNEYARKRARMLAKMGYTAFALDV